MLRINYTKGGIYLRLGAVNHRRAAVSVKGTMAITCEYYLPPLVLNNIAKHLPQDNIPVLRLVGPDWRDAASQQLQSLKPKRRLTSEQVAELCKAFPNIRSLDLTACPSAGLLPGLPVLKHLRALTLRGCTTLRGDTLDYISQLPSLASLDLSMVASGAASGLTDIRLAAMLTRLQARLQWLSLEGSGFVGMASLGALKGMEQLTFLDICGTTLAYCIICDRSIVMGGMQVLHAASVRATWSLGNSQSLRVRGNCE